MKPHSHSFLRLASVCIGVCLACGTQTAAAQRRGHVVDSLGAPVAFANVVALSPADSAVIAACVSGTDGAYRLPDTLTLRLLRVTAVGYEPLFYRPASPVDDLTLTLRALSATELGEAGVVYRRPVARLEQGALVTTVENTTLSKAGSAEDVLKQVPGLIRKSDEEGSLEVIGRGAPLIYLNGRQLRDLNELKQLRSDEIKQVEVIANPGAQYDASVNAVVRIRTVRRQGEGFGINVSNDYNQGRYASDRGSVRLNYRRGGLDASLTGGYDGGKHFWQSQNDQYTESPDTLWTLPFYNDGRTVSHSAYGVAEVNYEIGEHHSVGLRYKLERTLHEKSRGYLVSDILANGKYYDHLTNNIRNEGDDDPGHALNLYYDGRWGGGEFHVDADYFASGSSETSHYDEQSAEYEDRAFPTVNDVRNRLVAAKAHYAWPWLGGKVTLGGQFSFTDRHDSYYIPENHFGIDATRSRLRETTAAGFVQYAATFARRWQFTAGLRFEHVEQDYAEAGRRIDEQSPTYDNLFPSLSLATALGKAQLQFSYTSRTQRPSYGQLSSNVTYGNRFLLQGGNPNLKPSIVHSLNLTAVWKWLQGVATFDHYRDGILFWGTSLPERPSVTKISHINHNFSQFQAIATAAPAFGRWHPNLTLVYTQAFVRLPVLGGARRFRNPLFTLMTTQNVKLPAGFDFTAIYRLQTRGQYQNAEMTNLTHYLEAYVTKSLFKESLTLNVGVQDIFYSAVPKVRVYMPQSHFLQCGKGDTRQFYLKLNYTLNARRDKYKGQSAVEDAVKRL